MQTSFEHKFEKGQKGFVIMRYQNQPNVMKVLHAHISGIMYQDVESKETPTIVYLFRVEKKDPKAPDEAEQATSEEGFYPDLEAATKGLIDASAQLRETYENEIQAKKNEISRIRKEQDNIIKVLPDEIPYTPKTPKTPFLLKP